MRDRCRRDAQHVLNSWALGSQGRGVRLLTLHTCVLLPMQDSSRMDEVQAALAKVEVEIEALGAKLDKVEVDVEAARAQHDVAEVAELRKKEKQLRKEKEQLRKEKEQLRTKELLLLQRQPGALSS